MYRVTTPTHTFTLPIEAASCNVILVSYRQKGVAIDKKYTGTATDGIDVNGNDVIVTLSQEETKKFSRGDVTVQVRVMTVDGTVHASQSFSIKVKDVVNEDILQ